MSEGRLIAVVGPSGVGKDSVMGGMVAARPGLRLVRRTITRAPGLGGEDCDAVTPEEFEAAARSGAFCIHWAAHGLRYGIPADVLGDTARGMDCLANFSRSALGRASEVFGRLVVLNITAAPETLAQRLAGRGRETPQEITARLARAEHPLPKGLPVTTIANDGALDETVRRALAALQPERA